MIFGFFRTLIPNAIERAKTIAKEEKIPVFITETEYGKSGHEFTLKSASEFVLDPEDAPNLIASVTPRSRVKRYKRRRR